ADPLLTIRLETSTASKSEPVRPPSAWSASLLHRLSGAPERYQGDPLSARITPYVFMAWATIRAWVGSPEMSTVDLSRSRRRIGGSDGLDDDDAKWVAGHT